MSVSGLKQWWVIGDVVWWVEGGCWRWRVKVALGGGSGGWVVGRVAPPGRVAKVYFKGGSTETNGDGQWASYLRDYTPRTYMGQCH